jgi:hypothetical protein
MAMAKYHLAGDMVWNNKSMMDGGTVSLHSRDIATSCRFMHIALGNLALPVGSVLKTVFVLILLITSIRVSCPALPGSFIPASTQKVQGQDE